MLPAWLAVSAPVDEPAVGVLLTDLDGADSEQPACTGFVLVLGARAADVEEERLGVLQLIVDSDLIAEM
jgi:hypothetical protein